MCCEPALGFADRLQLGQVVDVPRLILGAQVGCKAKNRFRVSASFYSAGTQLFITVLALL